MNFRSTLWAAAIVMASAPSIWAADAIEPLVIEDAPARSDSAFSIYTAIGLVKIESNEIVYLGAGSDSVLSRLIWQSTAPMLTAGFDVAMPKGWTLSGKAQVGMSGDSYMEDYDWIDAPWFQGYGADDWTDRSQHDDTNLDWYFNGSVALGYDVIKDDTATLNVNAGFKYVDVQWAAKGGTYVYSDSGFRDDVGSFPDGEPGITFRQKFPAAFLGLDGEIKQDQWTFGGSLQAGLTFGASDIDNHWMRDLVFDDTLGSAPMVALEANAGYALDEKTSLFVTGTYDKIFTGRGDTTATDTVTDDSDTELDVAGGDFGAASISVGIKGSF
ncbi:omptin family outer membrane protease [Devosia sp.]|uniref:omptin family outer membrane protease n=1 Tax=Devosia sp. TaxID=1871048 RepID=UPI003BA94219